MAKPELGLKRICVSCSARFYDLNRSPAICPKCGAEQPVETPRARRVVDDVPEPKKPDSENDTDEDVDLGTDDDDSDDDVMEDTSDLDDSDDDISNDLEVNPEKDNDEN